MGLAAAIPGSTSAVKDTATASRRTARFTDKIGGRFVNTSSILLFGWSLSPSHGDLLCSEGMAKPIEYVN
jgi:hypothetical protein